MFFLFKKAQNNLINLSLYILSFFAAILLKCNSVVDRRVTQAFNISIYSSDVQINARRKLGAK